MARHGAAEDTFGFREEDGQTGKGRVCLLHVAPQNRLSESNYLRKQGARRPELRLHQAQTRLLLLLSSQLPRHPTGIPNPAAACGLLIFCCPGRTMFDGMT